MKAWLLLVYLGPSIGYLSVPNIATKAACEELWSDMNNVEPGIYHNKSIENSVVRCIPYTSRRR